MPLAEELASLMVRNGVTYPLSLIKSGFSALASVFRIQNKYPDVDADLADAWYGQGLVARNAGTLLQNGTIDSAQQIAPLPPSIDTPAPRFKYVITIGGRDRRTGLGVYRTIGIPGDGYLTIEQLERLVANWVNSEGNKYDVEWYSSGQLAWVIDSITQGIRGPA